MIVSKKQKICRMNYLVNFEKEKSIRDFNVQYCRGKGCMHQGVLFNWSKKYFQVEVFSKAREKWMICNQRICMIHQLSQSCSSKNIYIFQIYNFAQMLRENFAFLNNYANNYGILVRFFFEFLFANLALSARLYIK